MATKDSNTNSKDLPYDSPERAAALEKEVLEKVKNMVGGIHRTMEENLNILQDSTAQLGEMEGMVRKMREMQKEIDEKISDMKRAAAEKNIDIDKLLGKSNQLAIKGQQVLQTMEDELKEKIAQAVPKEACLFPNPKSKEELTKERLAKTRGARNNWLPMR